MYSTMVGALADMTYGRTIIKALNEFNIPIPSLSTAQAADHTGRKKENKQQSPSKITRICYTARYITITGFHYDNVPKEST
eukprot:scaffold135515_cov22-Prasinocladus_malaysianus.AAC.1